MNVIIKLTKLSFLTIKNGLIKVQNPKIKVAQNIDLKKFREEAREMGRKFREALKQ